MPHRYDPDVRHRRSIRLAGFDYAAAGVYFVTIVTQQRLPVLGAVADGVTELSSAGAMVAHWWDRLPSKFPNVQLDVSVVMPNHIHGVLAFSEEVDEPVGAAPRGRPEPNPTPGGRPHGAAPTLGDVITWFKTMTTNAYFRGVKEYHWGPVPARLWQRNYYEHVVRSPEDLDRLLRYIEQNPARWGEDEENPDRRP